MVNNTAASPGSPQGHFVDIHEVFHEEEHRDHHPSKITRKPEKQSSNPTLKPHDHYPKGTSHARFNRQVSLETGFSALQKESKVNGDRKLLSRSGESFGGFSSSNNGVVTEGRKDEFSIFRTKSTLSKQNSFLPLKKDSDHAERLQQTDNHNLVRGHEEQVNRSVPAGRYFAALRGPELDQVKENEDILLPKDELWPFLLRFPINCFGICLGLSSQTILWRALASSSATQFLHIPIVINLILWILALGVLILVSVTYVLKCVFYFEAVRREYFHPVRVNFFFAPWIVCMFLAIGIPPIILPNTPHPAIWCIFMAPLFVLELKIYGQWLSGGKRRLSKVANPSTHLSVVGNFVGAILASKVGWQEPAKFFWAVGFAHYLVLFVTLYQRLPTSEALPKELHPVYCMFIAAPSAASIAWETIYGEFNGLSRTCYFIALFLYLSLVVRINFFRGFGFSVAWWSYTFPMTTASLATIKYAEQVPCFLSKGLALTLSFVSSMMVSVLFVSTLLHAFIWKSLLPNDLAIAITEKKNNAGKAFSKDKKPFKKAYDIRRWTKQSPLSFGSSGAKKNVESHDFSEVQKGVNEQ